MIEDQLMEQIIGGAIETGGQTFTKIFMKEASIVNYGIRRVIR